MPSRIDALTAAQEARLPSWADEWIAHGLRCGEPDRDGFARGMRGCYEAAGLTPPDTVVWVSSPLVLALAAPIAAHVLDHGGSVDAATVALGDAVDARVRDAVLSAVRAVVGDAQATTSHASRDVRKAVAVGWNNYIGGQFWVGWYWRSPAVVQFFRRVCDLTLGAKLDAAADAYALTAQSACWWWPHQQFVMVSTRPTAIHLETVERRRRLHCETGPAVVWPDGWGVWAWHGVRVPPHVIEAPHTITVEMIQRESNAEVRRVMIERMGWDRWLEASGAIPVQSDRYGDLYRVDVDGVEVGIVVVTNSTPEADGTRKKYALLVDADAPTAHAAVASTFGMTADEYAPVIET